MKYFIGLGLALLVFACSAELPESGRSVTEKEAQPQDITINVNNINQNYLFDDPEKGFVDNLTLTDNVSISIVNSPTNTNTNNNCTIVDNSSDNASDNGSCTAFVLRVFRT